MSREAEHRTRTRIAWLFQLLLDAPYQYTCRQIADRAGVSIDTIYGDFQVMRDAGFPLDADKRYRYAFVRNKPHRQLKDLLHFSEEDQLLLHQAIDSLPHQTERHRQLKQKLASLYDFGRLGHAYLRRPYLTKVDLLQQACREKKQVVLEHYRSSNSNTIGDRRVEPFHVEPAEDTVQTYDVDKQKVNHFRISRIGRVRVLDDAAWQYEGHHNIRLTDPFRIVGNDQVTVRLRLRVGAYNELVERFPLTKSYIEETQEEGVYDFQCKVNRGFIGLTNFILGFYHQGIEVVEPEGLREKLREEVGRMGF